jgi:hypothetical protein
MTDRNTRRRVLQATGTIAALGLAGCLGGSDTGDGTTATAESTMAGTDDGMTNGTDDGTGTEESMTGTEMGEPVAVTVRIENVAPSGFYDADGPTGGDIWLTPGAYAIHTGESPLFTEGEAASIGLEALAEAGPPTGFPDEPGLIDELRDATGEMGVVSAGAYTPENTVADPNDPMGEVPGAPPIAPGGAFEFRIHVRPGQRLSFASMFVPSNDVFVAPGATGIDLWPTDGQPVEGDVTDAVELWDAGTEPNAQPPGEGPDQAPAQSSPDRGGTEGGVVRRLADVGDGYRYPAVADLLAVTLQPDGSMDGTDT